MIGQICEIKDDPEEQQLKMGYPKNLEIGSLVLVVCDLGGGFFLTLNESGHTLVCSEYLDVCSHHSLLAP